MGLPGLACLLACRLPLPYPYIQGKRASPPTFPRQLSTTLLPQAQHVRPLACALAAEAACVHDARTMPAPQQTNSLWPLVQTRPLAIPFPACKRQRVMGQDALRAKTRSGALPAPHCQPCRRSGSGARATRGHSRTPCVGARPASAAMGAIRVSSLIVMASLSVQRSERGREHALLTARGSHALLAARGSHAQIAACSSHDQTRSSS